MTIAPFGWKNESAPDLDAENLELDRQQIGEYAETVANSAREAAEAASDKAGSAASAQSAAEASVAAAVASKAPIASPSFTGTPKTESTPAAKDNSLKVATTAFVQAAREEEKERAEGVENTKAPKTSPALEGEPTATTPPEGNSSTRLATTDFVGKAVVPTLITGGNLGASHNVALGVKPVQFTGTLTAECTITLTGLTKGATAVLLLTQNGTGNWPVNISNGVESKPVAVASGAGISSALTVWVGADGETIYVQPGPQVGAKGTTGEKGEKGEKGATGAEGQAPDALRLAAWGVKSEPYPVVVAATAQAFLDKQVEGALIGLTAGTVLHGVCVHLVKGITATLTACYAVLYDSAGNLLTTSPQNQNTALNEKSSNAMVELPFFSSGTYEVKASGGFYAAVLCAGSAFPQILRASSTEKIAGVNGGVAPFVKQTGQATPNAKATFEPEPNPVWIGVY